MYRPAHFRENDPATLAAFIDAHPLAVLVAAGQAGLVANHIPLIRLENTDADGRMLLRGFEIVVERLEGKFKSSQNRTERERDGVVKGLTAHGDTPEMVAQIVRSKS
jgi:predicted FMN-binding regulatory protein PaiB